MTFDEIEFLDTLRVWHKERAEMAARHAKKARINRQGFIFQEAHHTLAAEVIEKAVRALDRQFRKTL